MKVNWRGTRNWLPKQKWMTSRGLSIPLPENRGPGTHIPKNVSESRAEELGEEWVEGELFPDPEGREDHPDKWVSSKNF